MMQKMSWIAALLILPGTARGPLLAVSTDDVPSQRFVDFVDPTYGAHVRQIHNSSGDEHNLYHYRSVFNADNSRMLGIETPKGSTDYRVTLYGGHGSYLKKLFIQREFDWTLAWDRHNPFLFYTRKDATVYRYNVDTSEAKAIKQFESPSIQGPSGLSLNQQGDRLLLRMSDNTVRTYRLPAMDDERICQIDLPDGWYANWDKLRFTGHENYFALTFEQKRHLPTGQPSKPPFTRIYNAIDGKLSSTHEGVTVGHHDFSSDGKFAYVEGFNQRLDMQVRVVKLDGTENQVVLRIPREKLRYVRNYHITWPAGVNDWFLLSFFPQTGRLPANYEPYLDEIVQVFVSGKHKILARTGTTCGTNFWAQPQQSTSADGRVVLFHTNGTGNVGKIGYESSETIDNCLLYIDK